MDPNLLHLIVAGGLTLVLVVITALIWSRAQVKTVFWWIGLTLIPMAVYLLGLGPAVVGAIQTLRTWWGMVQYTPMEIAGLVLGGLGVLLMLGSRLIPSESAADRRAARKDKKAAAKGVTQPAPRPAVGSAPTARPTAAPAQAPAKPASRGATASKDAEMDEIEELLRKRGIN